MQSWADLIKAKIVERNNLDVFLSDYHADGGKIVFTNGCFDLLHAGHVDYLSKASDLGTYLIVGLNEDDSISRLKGSNRPIKDFRSRSMLLASMQFIDLVVPFSEDTPENIIKIIEPDILVKGGDYTLDQIVGADLVKANGGDVKVIPFLEGYSSTSIISKIISQE